LPPVLIVQAGPGLPLLNDAHRFQQLLRLEQDFSVAYWDQRGCGKASAQDADRVSLASQVKDVGAVVRWLAETTGQRIVLLGISLGATAALQAAARESRDLKSLVAVSIDTDIAASDAAVHSFLQQASTTPGREKIAKSLREIGAPPYTTLAPFQARTRMLTDLGAIEHSKRFGEVLRGLLWSLIRTYGWLGAVKALRNMNTVQRRLLPEMATLNLFAGWPQPGIPVHYLFGANDPLNPGSLVERISAHAARGDTVATLADAGHMAHFDQPATVRAVIARAHTAS
jgi:pimeloyl-ACP methyl ester carboxylesterase